MICIVFPEAGGLMQRCAVNKFCASIPEEDRNVLCAACSKKRFAKGEVIDMAIYEQSMTLILEGAILYLKASTGGVQAINTAYDLLASEYLFNDHHIDYTDFGRIEAFRDTTVAVLPIGVMRKAFMEKPAVARAMYMNLSVIDNRKAFYRLMVQMEDAYHAVLYMMLYLKKRRIETPTHEEIAHLTGLNRVTVTRVMGRILRDENYSRLHEYMLSAMNEQRP